MSVGRVTPFPPPGRGRRPLTVALVNSSRPASWPGGSGLPEFQHRVGADNLVTSCDLGIFMDQAAEPVPAQNPDICAWSRWLRVPGRRALVQCPVRAVRVVVVDVLAVTQWQDYRHPHDLAPRSPCPGRAPGPSATRTSDRPTGGRFA